MSRMIPPFYEDKITSDGEKKIFDALQRLGDDYVILHSLGIAQHQEKVFGEIDFVVICKRGILCLEVKGGQVFRKNGVWHFTDRYNRENTKTEGPFRQVFSAMISLRKHLQKQFGHGDPLAVCQYACGVVFPDIPFTQTGPDIIQEIVYDSRCSVDELEKYINRVFDYWRDELQRKHGFSGGGLTAPQINKAENYLRGDFGFIPSLGYIVDKTEQKLLSLTTEQVSRLAMAGENPRILLKGGAGTGKTLLGLEHAKRCALTGKKVLYLCFNNNLSQYLKFVVLRDWNGLDDTLKVDTFHGFISGILREAGLCPSQDGYSKDEYYRNVLTEAYLDFVRNKIDLSEYDTLVVDEGQDLLRYEYIMCMDALLKGGLKNGNWHISYDPNQNIYNPQLDDGVDLIRENNPTVLTLDTNCRNTRPVGVYNTLFTGIQPSRFFRVNGENVTRESYLDEQDQRKKLIKTLKRIIGQGIRPGSIYILSRFSFENSCLKGENILSGICSFQNATDLDPRNLTDNSVKFSTIHSFKGLEAPVVFLIDVESFTEPMSRILNYTGMSRATSLLYVFYNNNAEAELNEMMSESASLLGIIE